jgi:hypothetical protein
MGLYLRLPGHHLAGDSKDTVRLVMGLQLPGEEARYAQFFVLLEAINNCSVLKPVLIETVAQADDELVKPLLRFHNHGQQLPHNCSTFSNDAAFGTDYYSRTAAAKSNSCHLAERNKILLPRP